MQKCTKCNQMLDESNFSFRNKSKRIRHKTCKTCKSVSAKKHYTKNKKSYIERAAKFKTKAIERNQEYVRKIKEAGGCKFCEESTPCCLDFHHESDNKLNNISDMTQNAVSIQTLNTEIQKCSLVCSNCHRKIHAGLL